MLLPRRFLDVEACLCYGKPMVGCLYLGCHAYYASFPDSGRGRVEFSGSNTPLNYHERSAERVVFLLATSCYTFRPSKPTLTLVM